MTLFKARESSYTPPLFLVFQAPLNHWNILSDTQEYKKHAPFINFESCDILAIFRLYKKY